MKWFKKLKSLLFKASETLIQPYIISANIVGKGGKYNFDDIIEIEWSNGIKTQYEGDCTVWNKLPYYNSCSTDFEGTLYTIQKYCNKWNGPYPTAHLKTNKK